MPVRDNLRRISERTIQAIWNYLYLRTDRLLTTDGRTINIISQGQWNSDAGPDFINAEIQIGKHVLRGDIEIHRHTSDWDRHYHTANPLYKKVILHVVYHHDTDKKPAGVPVLEIKHFLNAPLSRLIRKTERMEQTRRQIFCYDETVRHDEDFVYNWVTENGLVRFQEKVNNFKTLKAHAFYDFNELIYYGIMDALGFSKNRNAFQRLAQKIPLRNLFEAIRHDDDSTALMRLQAIMLGAAGLLEMEIQQAHNTPSLPFIQRLETLWQAYRAGVIVEPMAETEWKLFRTRPANFPSFRIAGFSRLLLSYRNPSFLERFIETARDINGADSFRMENMLIAEAYGYWSRHQLWNDSGTCVSRDLIGRQRASEIIINVILPVLYLYGELRNDEAWENRIRGIYRGAISRENNSVIRFMISQLFRKRSVPPNRYTMAFTQGLIRLHQRCAIYDCAECGLFEKMVQTAVESGDYGLYNWL